MQRLLFSHTEHVDSTPLLARHLDTPLGSKLETEFFRAGAKSNGLPTQSRLLLSDHRGEIEAGAGSGVSAPQRRVRSDRAFGANPPPR